MKYKCTVCWKIFKCINTLQAASFSARGLSTAYIASDQDDQQTIAGVLEGTYQLVFFTPEMLLLKKKWRHILMNDRYSEGLKAFVIDEAHVVKKW